MLLYTNQYVRDLAWIFTSAPLISEHLFNFAQAEFCQQWLLELEHNPEPLESHLSGKNLQMLGTYFEALWEYYLTNYPDKQLIAKNVQVFVGKDTLGEFDFIYSKPSLGEYYHLEVAVKYYLARPNLANVQSTSSMKDWLGPGTRDRLDKKYTKLLNRQSQLSNTPAGMKVLSDLGVSTVQSKTCLLGYLFYPFNHNITPPVAVHPSHNKGLWINQSALASVIKSGTLWAVLPKPHWLSCNIRHRSELSVAKNLLISVGQHFESSTDPLLLAQFTLITSQSLSRYHNDSYYSHQLLFVVADHWPASSD